MIDKDMLYEKLLGGALMSIYAYADRSVSDDDFGGEVTYTEVLERAICSGLYRIMPRVSMDERMSAASL